MSSGGSTSSMLSSSQKKGLILAMAAFVLAIGIAIGCSRSDQPASSSGSADNSTVVDMELMAFLSEARALHHQANLKEESGDLQGAAAAMDRLVAARRPHEGKAPEVQEVLADAYARLAELQLRMNSLGRASDAVKSGLTYTSEPTYFKGHLVEVEGLIEEARAAELSDAGHSEEAAHAREKAIQLLEEVVRIQDQVIQRSLAARDAAATTTTGDGGGAR